MFCFCSQLHWFWYARLFLVESFPWQTMEQADVQSLLQELTSTAYDMDTGQSEALVRACTIIEDMCSQKCREIIRRAQHRPCLQMFMSDGWSTDIRQRFRATSGSVDVQRTGRLRTEFIVQRTIVKAVLDSEVCMGMKIERPRPLAATKMQRYFFCRMRPCALIKACRP